MKKLLALPLLLLAFACAAPRGPVPGHASDSPDTCGIARYQHLMGVHINQIDRSTLPPRTRVITPDSMVTQDFSAERLNVLTGTDGRVSSLRCF